MISKEHPLYWRGAASTRGWAVTKDTVSSAHLHRFADLKDPSWVLVQRKTGGVRAGTQPGYTRTWYEYWQKTGNLYYLYRSYLGAAAADGKYYTPEPGAKYYWHCTCPAYKYSVGPFAKLGSHCKHIKWCMTQYDEGLRPPNQSKYEVSHLRIEQDD